MAWLQFLNDVILIKFSKHILLHLWNYTHARITHVKHNFVKIVFVCICLRRYLFFDSLLDYSVIISTL